MKTSISNCYRHDSVKEHNIALIHKSVTLFTSQELSAENSNCNEYMYYGCNVIMLTETDNKRFHSCEYKKRKPVTKG